MPPKFFLEKDAFVIENYNDARPFSSFLPGIAGEHGKPMWVFYTNRGQCVASFGVRDKNGAMLEFYPANKAYTLTPLFGFRTFIRIDRVIYEPFAVAPERGVRQTLRIRAEEIEIEEVNPRLGLKVVVSVFNIPNEPFPCLARRLSIQSTKQAPRPCVVIDGLPQVVPFGLGELPLKQMSRTMEAFAEIRHADENLPFYKLKVEPSDRPEMERIEGGFFAFSRAGRNWNRILIDPQNIFGLDTTFQHPLNFQDGYRFLSAPERQESTTGCAFSFSKLTLRRDQPQFIESYYGQADSWKAAKTFRSKIEKDPGYAARKHLESGELIRHLTSNFDLHSRIALLNGYTRQAFLDNMLRGGFPFILPDSDKGSQGFHYYSRKHGDMERDYNFFELAPTYYSQGNGNFRDVNQNRRSEVTLFPGLKACNVETFFNLIQLDGFNPLIIRFETFFIPKEKLMDAERLLGEAGSEELTGFLKEPFSPGELYQRLLTSLKDPERTRRCFTQILALAGKIQEAKHGEGFWIDHWTYNLDLLEDFRAIYPDDLRWLLVDRKDFTYFDNSHVVQPRSKKYVLREDGKVRQTHSVIEDSEKLELIRQRLQDPYKVRTGAGTGTIYQTSLLAKILGLIGIKAASLDPFGVGIEMEADKPGWCDAMNGLPGLFGSSVNEAFELRRWVFFVQAILPEVLGSEDKVLLAEEVAEFLTAVREALALAHIEDFFRTWDTLYSLKERFREKTKLGVSGVEKSWSQQDIHTFLQALGRILDAGLFKAEGPGGLYGTYFINELVKFEPLSSNPSATVRPGEIRIQTVKPLKFKQVPVSPFLEGPVHALRATQHPAKARKLYRAVKASELFDKKLKMFKLNVPLAKESFEIGRAKIFSPGWLENESVFLHMTYKFLLETLRSGLTEEFFEDLKTSLIAFQDPQRYGRSPLENSSFIASSRFPDARVHGTGFVARLTGATAEWISMVLFMGLGRQPFRKVEGKLQFQPEPVLPASFFTTAKDGEFEKGTFGFKAFDRTWIIYRNPSGGNTFGKKALKPIHFRLFYRDKRQETHAGSFLPESLSRDLREARLSRLVIELGHHSSALMDDGLAPRK